jgi:hypothetical protein
MITRTACVLLLAVPATAQTTCYVVRANGDLLRLDAATGATQVVGSSGVACAAGGSPWFAGNEWVYSTGDPTHPGRIVRIDRFTGAVGGSAELVGLPAGYTPRNLSAYSILHSEDPQAPDLLGWIDSWSGQCTVIGPTGRRDLKAAAGAYPNVYAIGPDSGGTLYMLDPGTGLATVIGTGDYGDSSTLAFGPDGSLLACGSTLIGINPATGGATAIGPTGFTDIRALASITRASCYVNCNSGCNPPPCLNVLDFNCFLNAFASGNPYANCDESTTPPTLNVLDFNCFLNRFIAGCTAP